MGYQLKKVLKAKSKALKVFTDTKVKFEKAIAQAQEYCEANGRAIDIKRTEISNLQYDNELMGKEIKDMLNSVQQINSIVGAE